MIYSAPDSKMKISQNIRLKLVFTLLVTCTIVAFSIIAIHGLLFNVFELTVPVYNLKNIELINLIIIITAASLVTVIIKDKLVTLVLGVFIGAISANIVSSQLFNKVPDYLYLPKAGDLYFNIADLLIVVTAGLLLLTLKKPLSRLWFKDNDHCY
jgi:lipoprotein signal peptidase